MTTPKRRGRPPKNTVTIKAVPKKRGRPRKIKNTDLEKEYIEHLLRMIENLETKVKDLGVTITNMRHQEIGYKALVSYFEYQLGLKASQNDNRTSI